MANIKISEMPVLNAITGAEWLPAYDSGQVLASQNQRLQIQQILPPGGTTGQLAAKASDSNYDIEWISSSGGGALSVLNIDFTAGEVLGNASSPVILSTYSMPANTVPAAGELIIESYMSYSQEMSEVVDDYPVFTLHHRLGGIYLISRRSVPLQLGQSGYPMTGWVKIETRMQSMNSLSSQYNSGFLSELTQNNSDGVLYSVSQSMFGQYPPTEHNLSSIDMSTSNTVELYVECTGTGSVTSKLIHRYTRVSLISP